MKFLFKLALLAVVIAIAVPIAQYRTLSACTMLKKELVKQSEEAVREAGAQIEAEVADADVELSEETQAAAEDVAEIVGDLVVGVSESVASAKVRRMSSGQCVEELVRIKLGFGSDDGES